MSVESPFRQHTQVDLEQDHNMSDDILNRGEVVHRALAISYWAPTRNPNRQTMVSRTYLPIRSGHRFMNGAILCIWSTMR